MSNMYQEADERLNALGKAVRVAAGLRVEFSGVSIPVVTVAGRVTVACHYQPWDGPLHFCVYDGDGPCRELGKGDQVTEVAGVVLRLLRS